MCGIAGILSLNGAPVFEAKNRLESETQFFDLPESGRSLRKTYPGENLKLKQSMCQQPSVQM